MGSPMDVTAEKLRFLTWQGHTSVPRGHQGTTCPTSHQLAPHPAPWGARPDPFNPSYVVPGTSCWPGCPQPPPTYAGAPPRPLPCPISAGSWVTAETHCILGFPMPWLSFLELTSPSRDPKLATVLPDPQPHLFTPIHSPGREEKGVSGSSSWRHRCSSHKACIFFFFPLTS